MLLANKKKSTDIFEILWATIIVDLRYHLTHITAYSVEEY